MTQEEKIIEAKRLYETANADQRYVLETLFPELRESEDERIRKGLIIFLTGFKEELGNPPAFCNVSTDEAIAWLEKQGTYYTKRDVDNAYVEGMAFAKDELEKQGEQKPINDTDEEIVEAVKDTSILDLVEPKFKVGDWVILCNRHESIYQVEKIENYRYYLRHYLGGSMSVHFDNALIRPWTIKDAKDGDVLVNWNNTTFIFKVIEDETVKFHIAYNKKWNTIKTPTTKFSHFGLPEPQFGFHPATKEQRDLLFQKMKEAGYEWNEKEKRLTKVPKTKEETGVLKQLIDESKSEIDYCFTKMMNGEKVSPTWSEEDEYTLYETIKHLEELIRIDKAKHCGVDVQYYQRDIDWIKSLKDRVQPQTKQKWSEEDEQYLLVCKNALAKYQRTDKWDAHIISRWLENKLKSLRPQDRWKPTTEQLRELRCVISGCSFETSILVELEENLKKLL